MREIAALYVMTGGHYFGLEGVDPWDETRNAMLYDRDLPVVAHPPCTRWCRLAKFVEKQYGHRVGEDGGTFAHALATVRRCGGVLEHPAWSLAWQAHGLPEPDPVGGWQRDIFGGWCCHVEQCHYGHRARKATWLYAVGCELPALKWGDGSATSTVGGCTRVRFSDGSVTYVRSKNRMGKPESNATPLPFRDILIAMARSVSDHYPSATWTPNSTGRTTGA